MNSVTKNLLEVRRLIEESPTPHKAGWHRTKRGVCLEGALLEVMLLRAIGGGLEPTVPNTRVVGVTWGDMYDSQEYRILRAAAAYGEDDPLALRTYNDKCTAKQEVVNICNKAINLSIETDPKRFG